MGIIGAGAIVLLIFFWFWGDRESKIMVDRYVSNEKLETIKPGWPGTPVEADGKFVNEEFPYEPKLTDLLRWKLGANPFKQAKKDDTERLEVKNPAAFLAGDQDGILWLGHASFFIRLDGVSILIDPVFGNPRFISRFVDVPSPLSAIRRVDYVLLSHDHRDHTDEDTLRQIAGRFPNAVFMGGLKMDDILRDWTNGNNSVATAGWFQRYDLPADVPQLYFVPVRHWSRRGLFDTNQRLWGGYVLKGKSTTIYFGGDSGYGRQYKDAAELFPNIDYFIVGIGAFEPRWFMKPNHNSPADALQAFVDTRARIMIPMHYGTFDLSDEPPGDPLRQLRQKASEMQLTERVKVLTINESLDLP